MIKIGNIIINENLIEQIVKNENIVENIVVVHFAGGQIVRFEGEQAKKLWDKFNHDAVDIESSD
jgi:acetylglutamate kinase